MRLKQTIAVSILAIAGLTSCEKNLYDPNQAKPSTKVEDLKIADDFDWKMIENATCVITSQQAVKVNIYADESLNEKSLLATIGIKSGKNATLPISLQRGAQNVYIQYEYASGNKEVIAAPIGANGKIDVTLPSKPGSRAITDDDFIKGESNTLYYPSTDFGTVMFEDNYPELGDYDFNDFVADYKFTLEMDPDNDSIEIKKITLEMEVKAIGAMYKYIPHLGLPIPAAYLDKIEVQTRTPHEKDEVIVENVTENSIKRNYIVLAFNGAENNSKKVPGSDFLNTEKGNKSETKTFIVDITFKESGESFANLGFIKADGFDIFLASSDRSKEIHMLGFTPVFKMEGDENTYKSKDNLVWGINIPISTAHAYEKGNFLSAYPNFRAWAEGSYESNNQWYTNSDSDFIFSFQTIP